MSARRDPSAACHGGPSWSGVTPQRTVNGFLADSLLVAPVARILPLPDAAPAGIVIDFENPPARLELTLPTAGLTPTLSTNRSFTFSPGPKFLPAPVTALPA